MYRLPAAVSVLRPRLGGGLVVLSVCAGLVLSTLSNGKAIAQSPVSEVKNQETTASKPNGGAGASNSLRLVSGAEDAPWSVLHGDQIIAAFVSESAGKPVIYPLSTIGGKKIVRSYPLEGSGPNEREDHPHHRSLWFTHGEVNGVDYWSTSEARQGGTIRQTGIQAKTDESSNAILVSTQNEWVDLQGNEVLKDARRYTFRVDGDRLILDCDFRLTAGKSDVNFGDTKEGSFGLRVAGSMKADAGAGGRILNAEGLLNKAAWGKKSSWVDYQGPVLDADLKASTMTAEDLRNATAGVTIHCHPSGFHAPCRWHVRDYGLFAANPFGVHHFTGGEPTEGVRLAAGESLDLYFRLVVRDGVFDLEATKADAIAYAAIQPRAVTSESSP